VADFLKALSGGEPCAYVTRLLQEAEADFQRGGSRHDTARTYSAKLVRAGEQGHEGTVAALDTLEAMFAAQIAAGGPRDADPGEWPRLVTGAVELVAGSPTPAGDKRCCGPHQPPITPVGPRRTETTHVDPTKRRAALAAFLDDLRTWQHLPDPAHVVASLAVAATRDDDGEACWLLLVAPPSSGKTEAVRVLDDAADARLDEVTSAGLLGWSKGRKPRPIGVLTRIPTHALLTFGDLSTLLATSDRGGRDQVFALLRRAYDGHASRDISPQGNATDGNPDRLEWSGRLTVVGCVTGAIDRYTAHADQLGARWLYVRLPDRTTAQKRHAALLARRGSLPEHRARAREGAARILSSTRPGMKLPDYLALVIEDAALVTAWGRGSVPRNGYGPRQIEGVPVVEEPMRLVQQLGSVARGVLALGLPEEAAAAIARRVALDSMPETRRAVLSVLATGEVLTTAGVARAARLDRKVARMTLEDLAAIGVVTHDRTEDEEEDPQGTVHWSLLGYDGELIAAVFR
jgi:hypothetical protein